MNLPSSWPSRSAPRLFALDVDGTLLTSDHRIPAAVREEVQRVTRAGVRVVLTTSRPPAALHAILTELQLFAPAVFIGSQGAITASYEAGGALTVLANSPMPPQAGRLAVETAVACGFAANWFTRDRWLVSHVDDEVLREAAIVGVAPEVADLTSETTGPDKILVIAPLAEAGRLAELAAVMPPGLQAITSNANYLEITAGGVDKATALRDYCNAERIPLAEIVAVGDGHNDLAMLALAGTAIAPANASAPVQAAADWVANSNDEGAVGQVLRLLVPARAG